MDYYVAHGQRLLHTVRCLGYPSKETLRTWISELHPELRKTITGSTAPHNLPRSRAAKQEAIIALNTRSGSAREVAERVGVTRETLYSWQHQLLSHTSLKPMPKQTETSPLEQQRADLLRELSDLERRVSKLRLERDVLEKAGELIKKDGGINLLGLTNREKTAVVDALKKYYPLTQLLQSLKLARSTYFYQRMRQALPDKYAQVRVAIRHLFDENYRCYGYRRIDKALRRQGVRLSEKIVRRLMAEKSLTVRTPRRQRFSAYAGDPTPAVPNLLKRNFQACAPNLKWLTDLTEIQIPAGKVYVSPIVDCFDGLVVAWTIGTRADANLVNTMLAHAVQTLQPDEHPIIHSDRGAHYRWPEWIRRADHARLARSMSKKGCSPDNAACEGFFGRLKTELIYPRNWRDVPLQDFMEQIDHYIRWYNERRIKLSLGGRSPTEYRQTLGLRPT